MKKRNKGLRRQKSPYLSKRTVEDLMKDYGPHNPPPRRNFRYHLYIGLQVFISMLLGVAILLTFLGCITGISELIRIGVASIATLIVLLVWLIASYHD